MAPLPPPYLLLRVDPAQRGVRERLLGLGADLDPARHEVLLPLGEAGAEEILAECRQLGIRVLGSAVRGDRLPG